MSKKTQTKVERDAIWIVGEDLAPGAVGPFPTFAAAAKHMRHMWDRGDAALVAHRNSAIVLHLDDRYLINVCSPLDDAPELYGVG